MSPRQLPRGSYCSRNNGERGGTFPTSRRQRESRACPAPRSFKTRQLFINANKNRRLTRLAECSPRDTSSRGTSREREASAHPMARSEVNKYSEPSRGKLVRALRVESGKTLGKRGGVTSTRLSYHGFREQREYSFALEIYHGSFEFEIIQIIISHAALEM